MNVPGAKLLSARLRSSHCSVPPAIDCQEKLTVAVDPWHWTDGKLRLAAGDLANCRRTGFLKMQAEAEKQYDGQQQFHQSYPLPFAHNEPSERALLSSCPARATTASSPTNHKTVQVTPSFNLASSLYGAHPKATFFRPQSWCDAARNHRFEAA